MEKIKPERLSNLANLLRTAQQHIAQHCDCEFLDPDCYVCDLRRDAISALDMFHVWEGETVVALARLTDTLDNQRTWMERSARGERCCAQCDDEATEIGEALGE